MSGIILSALKGVLYHRIQAKVINSLVYPMKMTSRTSINSSFTIAPQIQRHIIGSRSLIQNSSSNIKPQSISESTSENLTTSSPLDWEIFFQLRKKRRWYQQFFSIGSGFAGVTGGVQVLMYTNTEALISQIPLDPFIGLGLITFSSGGIGWLLGPIAGTAIFNWQHHDLRAQIDEREKEFYHRVRRHRVDPSNSSMANPVPDYYGEKVSSVAGYRLWLKDCRAFNKKRTTYLK